MVKILMKGKAGTVTADLVKPAHIEHEPETCSTQKRQMQSKPISMAKKPAAISRKPPTARARSRSTTTPKSLKTRGNSDKITSTLSSTLGVEPGPAIAPPGPAIAPWSNTTGARLPNPPTLYKASRTRTNINSRANGENVFEPTRAYPYICKTMLTIQKHRPHGRTFEAVLVLPITAKQMRIKSLHKHVLDVPSTHLLDSYSWFKRL